MQKFFMWLKAVSSCLTNWARAKNVMRKTTKLQINLLVPIDNDIFLHRISKLTKISLEISKLFLIQSNLNHVKMNVHWFFIEYNFYFSTQENIHSYLFIFQS